jgi:hypothetical protein
MAAVSVEFSNCAPAVIRRNTPRSSVFLSFLPFSSFLVVFYPVAWKITLVGRQRSDSQAVEAFSAPKELLLHARQRAVTLGMTMSGYLRYVVALELGYSEPEARDLALHPSIRQLRPPGHAPALIRSASPVPPHQLPREE